jgi:3-oxoacyl-[acyl-carrier-protein] synthase II
MWMLAYIPNMTACHVSILNNLQGPNNTITQSDSASLLAVGEAWRVVRRGAADLMLAGGGDARLDPLTIVRHWLFGQRLSQRQDEPERACRPFDRDRDGVVLGEGAGALVVEELGHAQRRGARIYAELAGFGAAMDLGRTGAGLARAVRAALEMAGIGPEDLDHVNAHGSGDPEGDRWEARGLREALGAPGPPVLAVKSYTGDMGSCASAAELAVSLLAWRHGLVPATLNHEEPDPECPVRVLREPRGPDRARPWVLKVSETERGQCAAVVVRRWEG